MILSADSSACPTAGQSEAGQRVTEAAWRWWKLNDFEEHQDGLHASAIRDGDAFIVVDWDEAPARPRWTVNYAYDGTRGVRNNLGFEGLALSPDNSRLFIAAENALLQDGPADPRAGKRWTVGAIAAVLCELDVPPEMGNGLFAISRTVGLTAHVFDEIVNQRPMRRISPTAQEYNGPPERDLE